MAKGKYFVGVSDDKIQNFIQHNLNEHLQTYRNLEKIFVDYFQTETTIPKTFLLRQELICQAKEGKIFLYSRDNRNLYCAFSKSNECATKAFKLIKAEDIRE